ncbi:FAD-binding oxidoreductase [Duganella levis]|uniref:M24 family metallopeptidase n=1 Tax=Duganella levis TaxID=2692169 RepID=A0ABW9W685_9BURK|nr:FAD-binding oxidoreductase [Duganella levis]MYN29483.1 M24 family metallopeptidase [Duganella levis]
MTEALPLHSLQQIGADIYRLILDGADRPMHYREGQFLSLQLPCGSLRSYSLAQPCQADGQLELHIRLRHGGRMAKWLPTLNKGDAITLHGPFGACTWQADDQTDSIIMLATGTGIAPLHAILRTVLADDNAPPVTLYWGARVLDELYLLEELQQLARQSFRFTFVPVLSRAAPEWAGERGHVQHVAAVRHPDLRNAKVYACGSGAMVTEAKALLASDCGLDSRRFFADTFEPAESVQDAEASTVQVETTLPDGRHHQAAVAVGDSLYRGLKSNKLMQGVCGGKLSCGTCRVRPEPAWAAVLPSISLAEQRLLASLVNYVAGDRLACQLPVTPAMNGLRLDIHTQLQTQTPRAQAQIEAVGSRYDAEGMLALRARTFEIIQLIAAQIHAGMVEEDALELAKAVLAEHGMLQGWHGVYVRFGRNTVKSWSEKSEPGVVLGKDDIYFIDIGPTWQGLEGDGAMTFLTGDNANMRRCQQDARIIFDEVRQHWLDTGDSGEALYEFARAATERRGWVLNLELSGHRLGDFPHTVHFDGTMAQVDFKPSPQLWVLEIHIRHPDLHYGAYFEDLLLTGAAAH